jgi:hypothetical protein
MNWGEIGWLLIGFLIGATLLKRLGPALYRFWLKIRFWMQHGKKGRPVLFFYSDSSMWKEHMEAKILPRLTPSSVVLNWSKRREWEGRRPLETKIYEQWAGSGEFVPLAIMLPLTAPAKVFRLWDLAKGQKHGKDRPSKEAEQSLFAAIREITNK